MQKVLSMVLIGLGAAGTLLAGATPEIDPASGVGALTLLAGACLLIRSKTAKLK